MGWPVLVHCCNKCNHNTPIEYSTTVWIQEHTCSHCGIKSVGADIASTTAGTMNSTQHDELAQLFAQNMQLSQHQASAVQPEQAPVIDSVPQISEKHSDAPLHFASAHYTQSAHVRLDSSHSEPSRSPPPSYHEAMMPEAMAETLRQHSIDPSALLPSQINLFLNADYEQRLRLLELWRIAPPSYPLEQHVQAQVAWMPTSVEREEKEAQARFELNMHSRAHPPEEHMFDTVAVEPISPIRGPGEPAWPLAARVRAASIAAGQRAEVEPYIVNGYEIAVSPRAVEPVYAANFWQTPGYVPNQESSMENQYGMYEQIRNHADWERMNEQLAREKFVGLHGPMGVDDDMVM